MYMQNKVSAIFGELRSLLGGPQLKHQFHRIQRLVHRASPQEQTEVLIPYCLEQLKGWPLESRVVTFKGSQRAHLRDTLATTWELRNVTSSKDFVQDALETFEGLQTQARIERLRVYASDLEETDLGALLHLPLLSGIEELRLQDNGLTFSDKTSLSPCLIPNLRTFCLRDNLVTSGFMISLLKGELAPNIETVTMTPDSSYFLWPHAKNALPLAPTLRHLSLALCHPVSPGDLEWIIEDTHFQNLETLSLTPLLTRESDILHRMSISPNLSPSVRAQYAELSAERERYIARYGY